MIIDEKDLPFLARAQARQSKREKKLKKRGKLKTPPPKIESLIDRIVAGATVQEVVDELTKTSAIARYPKPMGLVRPRRIKRERGQGKVPYIGYREPISSPVPTSHRSYESAEDINNPWKRALRRKRYRGMNVGFGKSRAMSEKKKKGHISGGEPQAKPEHLKAKMKEVGLSKDSKGYFVYTHRSRSDSYKTPDAIPDKDIEFIATTG